ncbi:MAG: PHP domain-containing protein [Desulfobacteraceae bacterium]|jgi:predicted metal-dependent phosphoesterase TrpH
MKADLHLHTTASDGTWTPEALIENIIRAGITVFAVTDHDSVENVATTVDLVKDTDLKFIRGVEVNTTENGHLFHILGYNVDPDNESLNEILLKNRNVMEDRDERSIKVLQEMDYPVVLDEFLVYENNPERGGWKALNYILDKGLCQNYKEFFKLLGNKRNGLGIEGCARPEDAISAIKEAGGIPILAHPGSPLYGNNAKETVSLAIEMGVEGVECFHPENGDEATEYCLELCRMENLFITGGSDCHGTFVKERWLGKPDIDLEQLALWEL